MTIWFKIVHALNKDPENLPMQYQEIVTAYISMYGYDNFRAYVNSVHYELIQQQQQHKEGFHAYVKRQCVRE